MDYERIHKPLSHQSGGLSPSKLRGMLLGLEKKRKEEEELECKSSLRSEALPEFEERRTSVAESYKDVECSTSAEISSSNRSRVRSQEDSSLDSDSVSSGFEFQRVDRVPTNRISVAAGFVPPFLKPAPSKWDDAQKWIASPTANRGGNKSGTGQVKKGNYGYGGRQGMMKFVVDEVDEVGTKKIDGKSKKDDVEIKSMNYVDSRVKPVVDSSDNLSQHDLSTKIQSGTIFATPTSIVRAVSMRDMGTEMTPVASQEPSRTGTPARATSPLHSPTSSQPPTPKRIGRSPTPTDTSDKEDSSDKKLSDNELKRKIRRDIMVLGQQLGKTNITAWASKEEEETDASAKHETVTEDQPVKSGTEARAAAWEDAEKAKYLARFKQEEIKIQAWENHQKAKTEAEMKKIEVEVERLRSHAQEKLMNQLATTRHKAEEMRAAAESKRNQQAAKTAQQAEYIRKTGQTPPFLRWSCCF